MDERRDEHLVAALEREAEYRDLLARHRAFEARLAELAKRPFLVPDEEHERSTLKKLKLRVKDRMEALTRTAPRARA